MGAWRRAGKAAVAAVVLCAAARAAASTVAEPIARLSLEGGWDSNALYRGTADTENRISPELGLRLRDPLWTFAGSYGADWIRYQQLQPNGAWSHRLLLRLEAHPARRWTIRGDAHGAYAFDPVGLALIGIFRTGRQSALVGRLNARVTYRIAPRVDGVVDAAEQTVRFDDRTGGAMHAAGAAGMWRWTERLSVGAGYRLSLFQGSHPTFQDLAYANALQARVTYEIDRHLAVEAAAGPETWARPGTFNIVPEATVTLTRTERDSDLRITAHHGLGIGSTAAPGLVTSIEGGAVHRFGRSFLLKGDGGLWNSGVAPSGAHPVLGYAASGEAAWLMTRGLRLSLVAARFATLNQPANDRLTRTTVGLQLGWELEPR